MKKAFWLVLALGLVLVVCFAVVGRKVGAQTSGNSCQACNSNCNAPCVPGIMTPFGCEPAEGYTMPYCAPPTTAVGTENGYYNQEGQPYNPATDLNWYYQDSSGNWWSCGGAGGAGTGCIEENPAGGLLSWQQNGTGASQGNTSNVYTDPCFIKKFYPPDQAQSEIATLKGVSASSIDLNTVCPEGAGYCEYELSLGAHVDAQTCGIASSSLGFAAIQSDFSKVMAAVTYYSPLSVKYKQSHPEFQYATLVPPAQLNSDGTVTISYSGISPMTQDYQTFRVTECSDVMQIAAALGDHSNDAICGYTPAAVTLSENNQAGTGTSGGTSGSATQTPTPAVYVNGVKSTSAVCGSTYTFKVDNYTGSSVWLEQTKNGQPRYNSATNGPYAVPTTSQFVCNQDEGTYVNNVYSVVQGSNASGSASTGVTDIPTLVADYNQAASIINQMNQAWSQANNNAPISVHLTIVSYSGDSSGVTINFSDGTTRSTTLQDLQVSVQDAVTIAQGMVARPLKGAEATAASLVSAANALGTITGQTTSESSSVSKGALLGSVTFTVTSSTSGTGTATTGGSSAATPATCATAIHQAAAQVTNLEAEIKPLIQQMGTDPSALSAAQELFTHVVAAVSNTIKEFCGVSIGSTSTKTSSNGSATLSCTASPATVSVGQEVTVRSSDNLMRFWSSDGATYYGTKLYTSPPYQYVNAAAPVFTYDSPGSKTIVLATTTTSNPSNPYQTLTTCSVTVTAAAATSTQNCTTVSTPPTPTQATVSALSDAFKYYQDALYKNPPPPSPLGPNYVTSMASSYYSSLYRRNVYLNASLNTDGTVAYTEIDEMLPGCAQASADNPCHSIDNRPQYTPGLDYLSYRDGACGGITTIAQYLNNQSETGICSQTEPQTNTVCASASNSGSTGGTSSSVSIATASLPNGKIGQAYNVTMRATGGSGNYLWGISQPLQAGLNWSSSGIIYGTPTESGTLTFTISAFDTSTKQVVFKTFSLTVGSTT